MYYVNSFSWFRWFRWSTFTCLCDFLLCINIWSVCHNFVLVSFSSLFSLCQTIHIILKLTLREHTAMSITMYPTSHSTCLEMNLLRYLCRYLFPIGYQYQTHHGPRPPPQCGRYTEEKALLSCCQRRCGDPMFLLCWEILRYMVSQYSRGSLIVYLFLVNVEHNIYPYLYYNQADTFYTCTTMLLEQVFYNYKYISSSLKQCAYYSDVHSFNIRGSRTELRVVLHIQN